MARKKKTKQQNINKEVPQKEYSLITDEDLRELETKHIAHVADVRVALKLYNEAVQEVEKRKVARTKTRKWNDYVAAEGLPKPYIPSEIRMFFEKMCYFESESIRTTIDWQLAINERSILCQNIYQKDLTRKNLLKRSPNFGIEYNNNIELSLKVLESIGYYLDNKKSVQQCRPSVLQDIMEERVVIQQDIMKFVDRYVYRVLCSENAYMEQIDAITGEYCYGGIDFEIHLWTLKHVPITFNSAEHPSMVANLYKVKVKLQIPYSILKEDLTVRAIHYQFDHFSEHCKSYDKETFVSKDTNTSTDLELCLENEWILLNDIRAEVRNKIILARLEYEQKIKQLEEEIARKAKEKGERVPKKDNNANPAVRPKKGVKEPQIMADNAHPDVWEDFIEKEHKLFESFLNDRYLPKALNLTDDEINLKRYMILGGIYQVYVVSKPAHVDFNSLNVTWHANNGNLHIDKNLKANMRSKLSRVAKRLIKTSSGVTSTEANHQSSALALLAFAAAESERNRRMALGQKSKPESKPGDKREKYTKDIETQPCFVITFELPHYLCLWNDEPQPCHFEADVIGFVKVIKQTVSSSSEKISTADTAYSGIDVISITSTPNTNATHTAFTQSTSISRRGLGDNFGISKSGVGFQLDEEGINDFNLNLPMTKSQLRIVERHCLPRIISSFKFPLEIVEEANEESRNKPKGQGGTLVRRRVSGSGDGLEVKSNERCYDILKQKNPERLFPIFPKSGPPRILFGMDNLAEKIATFEPETLLQLIDVFDNIKRIYRINSIKIYEMPVFATKYREERIRQLKALRETQLYDSSTTTIDGKINLKNSRPIIERRKSKPLLHRSTSETGDNKPEEKKSENKISDERKSEVKVPEEKKSEMKTLEERKPEAKAQEETKSESETIEEKKCDSKTREDKKLEIRTTDEMKSEIESNRVEMKPYLYSHWTNQHILHSVYDKEKCTVTVWTDRLGTFGFAFKHYEHFPFQSWSLEPSEENPETEVVLRIDTQFVRCFIYITAEGFRCYVTDFSTKYVRNPVVYLEIKNPQMSIKNFQKAFRKKHLNIFTKQDARFYIENGYFSEKHAASELHTYTAIALHCLSMKFKSSDWNRLATRRNIVLRLALAKDTDENFNTLRITPESATFVNVSERCSDNLDEITLDYTLTWRNYEFYSDLHHIITSTYPLEERVKEPNLIYHVRNILNELRLLSYS